MGKKQNIARPVKKQTATKSVKPSIAAFPGGMTVAAALIIIAGIVCYFNSFGCSFHFDDIPIIPDNPAIRDISNTSAWWNFYPTRPVGIFTVVLNYALGGTNVWGYHFVNLLIHIINGLLVFWLVILLFKTPALRKEKLAEKKVFIALIAAMLFVAHPVQTQAVTYIIQRLASLAALFFMLSVCLYIKARIQDTVRQKKILLYGAAAIAALLAFLTKENTFTLPLIIVLIELFFIRQSPVKIRLADWKLWAFIGLTGIAAFILLRSFSFSVFSPILPEQGHTYTLTAGTYLLTQFRVITTYIRLIFLPYGLNLDYDYPISQSFFEIKTILSFLFLLALLLLAVLMYKKYRLASFGIFWFFITLSIESGLIPVANVIFEHRLYLPSVGIFLVVAGLPFALLKDRFFKPVVILFLLAAAVLCVLTVNRNKIWKTEFTLWEDVAKKSPNKTRPLMNFANSLRDQKRYREAMEYYDRAIKNNPQYDVAFLNRGKNKSLMKDFSAALLDYNMAVKLNPSNPGAYNNCGLAKYELHNYAGAIADLNTALRLNPAFPEAYNNRANVRSALKDFAGALLDFANSLRLNPNAPETYNNRASVRFEMQDAEGAMADINKALQLKPDYPDAYNNRANIKAASKDFAGSISDFDQVIRLDPMADYAFCNRGTSKYFMNDLSGACADWGTAAQMGNGEASFYMNQYCKK